MDAESKTLDFKADRTQCHPVVTLVLFSSNNVTQVQVALTRRKLYPAWPGNFVCGRNITWREKDLTQAWKISSAFCCNTVETVIEF